MHKVDGPGATPTNGFTEGSPSTGTPATTVTADIMNALQEEICNVITAGAGLTLSKPDNTQLLQAILSLASSSTGSGQALGVNNIINGEMAIFQRAASTPGGVLTKSSITAATYGLDRWEVQCQVSGTGTGTVSRQAFTVGQTDVPGNPTWYMRLQQLSTAGGQPFIRTKLEDVARYAGAPFTFSAWMKAAASLGISMRIVQHFGSGGSADVVVATSVATLGTAWSRESVTGTLPSVSGKTIGAGNALILEILLPTGATFTIDVADAQGEFNGAPTPVQRRSRTIEAALCQRYYEKSWALDVISATAAGYEGAVSAVSALTGDAARSLQRPFRVEKRIAPTMTWYGPGGGVGILSDLGSLGVSGTSAASVCSTGYPLVTTQTPAEMMEAHWTAEAEL